LSQPLTYRSLYIEPKTRRKTIENPANQTQINTNKTRGKVGGMGESKLLGDLRLPQHPAHIVSLFPVPDPQGNSLDR